MKVNQKVWCWWLSRFLYFQGCDSQGRGKFEDIAGARFTFTQVEMDKLQEV